MIVEYFAPCGDALGLGRAQRIEGRQHVVAYGGLHCEQECEVVDRESPDPDDRVLVVAILTAHLAG